MRHLNYYRTTKLATFPDCLWIQLRKFTMAEDWTPVKLDVAVEIPQVLDLSFVRGSGQQSGEILMADDVAGQLTKFSSLLATH